MLDIFCSGQRILMIFVFFEVRSNISMRLLGTIAIGITDEWGWTKIYLCNNFHRKNNPKQKYFSVRKQKCVFEKIETRRSVATTDPDPCHPCGNGVCPPCATFRCTIWNPAKAGLAPRVMLVQTRIFVQPHSCVMPTAIVYRVVAAISWSWPRKTS